MSIYLTIKYTIDFIFSSILIILLFPLFFFLSFLILCVDCQAPLFFQSRSGLYGRSFLLFKFRTMRPSNSIGDLHSSSRVTPLGRILRSLSLDELPQLFNIFKGDMSFVGPRPLLPEYIPLYSPHQFQRHSVRPGLTGLSQISGRNLLSWRKRFEIDVLYVHQVNFFVDLNILLKTFSVVFSRSSTVATDSVIMTPFNGDN